MNKSSKSKRSSLKRSRGVLTRKENTFIRAIIRGETLAAAYHRVSPNCKYTSAKTSGANWLKKPHIQKRLEELQSRSDANISDEIVQEMTENYLSMHEYRMKLANVVRGNVKVNKHFKIKDEIRTIQDDVNPNVVLNAIVADIKIANGWYDRKKPPEIKLPQNTEQVVAAKKEIPLPRPKRYLVYLGRERPSGDEDYPELTVEEEKALYQMSLTNKNISTTSMKLTPDEEKRGCEVGRFEETGIWYKYCSDTAEPADLKKTIKVNSFYSEPYDDEQLANISKNSKVITGLLNNEYCICFIGGIDTSWADEEENGKENEKDKGNTIPLSDSRSAPAQQSPSLSPDPHSSPALRTAAKQQYRPVKEIWKEYWDAWCSYPSARANQQYLEVYTMYKAMRDTKELPKARKSNVWEFHPNDSTLMRKKTA